MNWFRAFLSLLAVVGLTGAAGAAESANAAAQFDAANKLYAQSKFAEAATRYDELIAKGEVSPALYFNLGNACFKAGQMGRAIAAYRQAEALSPRDPDVRANLQFARNQVQGPKQLTSAWQRWLGNLTGLEWLGLTTAAVWVTLGLFIARLLKPAWTATLRPWTWGAVGAAGLVVAAALLARRNATSAQPAIVIMADATIRNGPFDESPSTFTAHDGAELQVLDHKDEWVQVTDGGRNVGWVKRAAVTF